MSHNRGVVGRHYKLNANLSKKVKLRWQGVLKVQSKPTELDKQRKFNDKYDKAIKSMLPGEIFVKESGLIGPIRGLKNREGKVTIIDNEGKKHKLKIRWNPEEFWRLNVLNQLYVTKEPMIITVKNNWWFF